MKSTDFIQKCTVGGQTVWYHGIKGLEQKGLSDIGRLPYSIRILVENLVRKCDGKVVGEDDVLAVARWQSRYDRPPEIPFYPGRVLMQDFTGVPAVVDLAAMRDAVKALGKDPAIINPLVPVDLVVDHSVQVDAFGSPSALTTNVALEYGRNAERYSLLKWAQHSFANFRVVPPNSGICHQVNLEYLGQVIADTTADGRRLAFADTLVGTDSHTTMINGIGVLGWGVGGIEAEAVMLGQPYTMAIPQVIGVHLTGSLAQGVTATDLVLTLTELLRNHNVVEKFVEFFGPGMAALAVPDRATIANMAPEYGATVGYFPIDDKTIAYLRATGRGRRADVVKTLAPAMGLFYNPDRAPDYTTVIALDLGSVTACLAGPARPQDRIGLPDLPKAAAALLGCNYQRDADQAHISHFHDESGTRTVRNEGCLPCRPRCFPLSVAGRQGWIADGSIVIAAITSCTNTSNPHAMIGAGLLAQNAVARGLSVAPIVKTSLAPGSTVVTRYLQDAGLMPALEALGFHLVAFGCTTCIGNSGPLDPAVQNVITENNLTVAAVLSGNRNFEARIHQNVRANFLGSPMLVVALALAGRIDIDLTTEPLANDPQGRPVFLADLWPAADEIAGLVRRHVTSALYEKAYADVFAGDRFWQDLGALGGATHNWNPESTYIKNPPYFNDFSVKPGKPADIENARMLLVLGDSVTTDHISPAGAIAPSYPAGQYLEARGVAPADFNSYGSRRGNHDVMMRGTFANIRIKNKMVAPQEGGYTRKLPEDKTCFVHDAAMAYAAEGVPLVVVAGKEYGTGSSRDWAAKGTHLLGVKAVIAVSFERIHRSNLVGMGVLPLVFDPGHNSQSLGLDGTETYFIGPITAMTPRKRLAVTAVKADGRQIRFGVTARLDTPVDVDYFENGGILPCVLRQLLDNAEG